MPKNFQPLIDELRTIIENSRSGRLPTAEEQRGASLFKELVLSGGKALTGLLESLGDLPWFVPVTGTLEAWPELTPARRRNFLAALKPLEAEPFRRMRFSIARGLHKIDPASALTLIVTRAPNSQNASPSSSVNAYPRLARSLDVVDMQALLRSCGEQLAPSFSPGQRDRTVLP